MAYVVFMCRSAEHKNNSADKDPTFHFSPLNCWIVVYGLFCSLKKGITLNICMSCFVLKNSILLNLLCVWIYIEISLALRPCILDSAVDHGAIYATTHALFSLSPCCCIYMWSGPDMNQKLIVTAPNCSKLPMTLKNLTLPEFSNFQNNIRWWVMECEPCSSYKVSVLSKALCVLILFQNAGNQLCFRLCGVWGVFFQGGGGGGWGEGFFCINWDIAIYMVWSAVTDLQQLSNKKPNSWQPTSRLQYHSKILTFRWKLTMSDVDFTGMVRGAGVRLGKKLQAQMLKPTIGTSINTTQQIASKTKQQKVCSCRKTAAIHC